MDTQHIKHLYLTDSMSSDQDADKKLLSGFLNRSLKSDS